MTSIIVDANVAVYTVLGAPTAKLNECVDQFWAWARADELDLFAPRLWWSEVTSVLRAYVFQKVITEKDAAEALQILTSLHLGYVNEDANLSLRALSWAGRLGQAKAYDAMYLAAAESLGADLWTADERLASRCQEIGLTWVHSLLEI